MSKNRNSLKQLAVLSGVGLGFLLTGQTIFADELETSPAEDPINASPEIGSQVSDDVYIEDQQSAETQTGSKEVSSSYVQTVDDTDMDDAQLAEDETEPEINNSIPELSVKAYGATGGQSDSLAPGVYTISSAVSTGQVVDVNAGATYSGANVQIYENNDSGAQIWRIDLDHSGYYTFTNIQSNKVLDVNAGLAVNGNNVQQYAANQTMAQKWIVKKADIGFVIASALNNQYVLDLAGANSANGSNIQIYQSNNTKAQRWFFNKYITKEQEMDSMAAMNKNLVANGQYYIVNSQTGQVLSVYGQSTSNQANVDLEKNYQASSQVWEISHDSKGYITFKNIGSGKVLDVAGANTASGTNLQIYESNGTRAQKWVVRKDGSNFEIISALDPDRAIAQSGSNAQISVQNSSLAAEKWILKKAEDLRTRLDQIAKNNLNVVADGAYVIRSALNDKMVLDVNAGSTANGANIQVYEYNGSNAQKFLITNDAKGYVTIKNIGSGKFVSVDGKGWNGNNVMQSAQSNGWNQKWIIVKTNNTYQIVSALNDSFVLDVTAALAMNGTNIQIYESNGTKAQQFLFGSLNKDDSLWISSNNYLTVSQMENNAQLVWNFFKGYGWTKNAVAALLGNMQGESNINPGLWESRDEGNMNCGYGLVQWTPANKVIDWLESNGYAINSGFGQCARIIYELENHIQYYATNAFNFSFYDFAHSTQTPEYLAKAFIYNYERPYNYNQPQRETYARNWYNYISKL